MSILSAQQCRWTTTHLAFWIELEKDKAGLVSEIIALAWADEVSFDAIERVHGLPEKDVIALMFEPQNPVATGPGASA